MVVEVPRGEAPGGARRLALSSPVGLGPPCLERGLNGFKTLLSFSVKSDGFAYLPCVDGLGFVSRLRI
jgi:hypothetical protein